MGKHLTEKYVDEILQAPKYLVRRMVWAKKLNSKTPQWMLYQSPVEIDGRVPEGWFVIAQWRAATGIAPEKYGMSLMIEGARVYAIDVDPIGQHKNNIGRGRPYFKQSIDGNHVHLWSAEGEGYVEPIDLGDAPIAATWELFCRRANIIPAGPFMDPDPKRGVGQMGFEI